MMQESFFQLSLEKLSAIVKEAGYKEVHASSIFTSIYKNRVKSFQKMNSLPKKLMEELSERIDLKLPKKIKTQVSKDQQTIKFLTLLDDGLYVETVLVPFHKKYTICISSQVGCAMKCSFCYTGTQGLSRHLKVSEIIGQYLLAFDWIKENMPEKAAAPNIVFMGQGEPLHNFSAVQAAVDIFLTTEGLDLGPRQITLSTAGYLPGLKNFTLMKGINLALSLHSPFNDERSKLIPLNQTYPIEEIVETMRTLPLKKRQFLTFEYLVIKDLNHDTRHVEALKKLLNGLPAIINLIPFNEFPGSEFKTPEVDSVEAFKEGLIKSGFHTMIRTTKGDDILAACGQLNSD